jgi:hypothetical protein
MTWIREVLLSQPAAYEASGIGPVGPVPARQKRPRAAHLGGKPAQTATSAALVHRVYQNDRNAPARAVRGERMPQPGEDPGLLSGLPAVAA